MQHSQLRGRPFLGKVWACTWLFTKELFCCESYNIFQNNHFLGHLISFWFIEIQKWTNLHQALTNSACSKIKLWMTLNFFSLDRSAKYLQSWLQRHQKERSNHQSCYIIKGVLKNFTKFAEKHLCLRPETLLKRRLWHRCSPVNFMKFSRKPFLQNSSGRLLLEGLRLIRFFCLHFSLAGFDHV